MPRISYPSPMSNILRDLQIFVVDDDTDNRYMYQVLLEAYGATVITANSVAEALTLLEHTKPNLLICEIRFRGEDFGPLFERVKGENLEGEPMMPVLVSSAHCSAHWAQKILQQADAYLLKPIDIYGLVYKVWSLTHTAVIRELVAGEK